MSEPRWSDETYAEWDKFNDARNDFMNATTSTKLRQSGDPYAAHSAMDDLCAAVSKLTNHLLRAAPSQPEGNEG